mgnify:CR=1 FL=1
MDPHVWQVMVDAFPQLLFKGITVTIPLTIISFALSMVIAVVVALIQYSKVPVLRHICRFYVWVIRGTPLLVQLYVVFLRTSKYRHYGGCLPCSCDCFLNQRRCL